MWSGFWGKIIRINLSKEKVEFESVSEDTFKKYLSGSGLAAKILYEELDDSLEPLHPDSPALLSMFY